jgi:imidazole glycerol-phosphate synthase subunit HisH
MYRALILNYGMGNIDSVARAVAECGGDPTISSRREDLQSATHIILPGVGSYHTAMINLRNLELVDAIKEQVRFHGIPILGLCLGMQLLSSRGYEVLETDGLDLIPGEVTALKPMNSSQLKIPHVGWNEVHFKRDSPLFEGIPSGKDYYFVHSYCFRCYNQENVLATTFYGSEFASVVGNSENIFGTQFHPEKSQKIGLKLLANFLSH